MATPTVTVYCTGCTRNVDVSREEFFAMERAQRLIQRHATGEYRGGTWVPYAWLTVACNGCLARHQLPESVAFQMSRIRRHAQEIASRGVAVDEAIAYAVTSQMIRSEIKVSPRFVAYITGLEKLLEAHPSGTPLD